MVYRLVASSFRADTIAVPMRDFTHDLPAMLKAVTPATRLVFISNPNNPTGTMVDGAAIADFMERVPRHVVVVMDEAYIELLPPDRQPDVLRYVREGRHSGLCCARSPRPTGWPACGSATPWRPRRGSTCCTAYASSFQR